MATLENVKLLLSINDNVQDELLKRIIDNTEKRLISLLLAIWKLSRIDWNTSWKK